MECMNFYNECNDLNIIKTALLYNDNTNTNKVIDYFTSKIKIDTNLYEFDEEKLSYYIAEIFYFNHQYKLNQDLECDAQEFLDKIYKLIKDIETNTEDYCYKYSKEDKLPTLTIKQAHKLLKGIPNDTDVKINFGVEDDDFNTLIRMYNDTSDSLTINTIEEFKD